ncbi:hypothetical protein L5515_001015 [Caenorhabditis briggsae]|uniref:Uncharacterized protein n=1 Tax=Caenorhabditis briggsae TaxID=6238 RepID=A0AAE9DSK3_CAEBR|nr:hypothetical protein L3Y34_014935 [Caenorhabditis briggsae]UMM12034.1 hypothetical protein L5515_001015 [Caenorhabditis briggsae]
MNCKFYEHLFRLEPSTSTALFSTLPVPPTNTPSKTNRRKKENADMVVSIPATVPPPQHFEMQMFDPSWNHGVPWAHDVYHQYPQSYLPPPVAPIVGYPEVPIAQIDYSPWQQNDVQMQMPSLTHGFIPDAQKIVPPPHQPMTHFSDYPVPTTHHHYHLHHHHTLKQDNFHLISEVTNLLGT